MITKKLTGSCACGASKFTLSQMPTQRLKCHCTICQSVYKAACSDFLLADAKTVKIDDESTVEYAQYKKPPALDRGICTKCQKPVMGYMALTPGIRMAFIPAYTLGDNENLPAASRHIWYHSRSADVDDDLPKYSGKLRSNFACLGPFYKGFRAKA